MMIGNFIAMRCIRNVNKKTISKTRGRHHDSRVPLADHLDGSVVGIYHWTV